MTPPGLIERLLTSAGRRVGLTASQAYTVATGLLVCAVLSAFGLPPVFRTVVDPVVPFAAPAADRASGDPRPDETAPPPSPPTVPRPPPAPTGVGDGTPPSSTAPDPPEPEPQPADPGISPPLDHVGDVELIADLELPGVPGAMAVADDGTIYLATDTVNPTDLTGAASTIVAVDEAGDIVGTWEVPRQPAVRTRGITGLAIDGDRVVAADASRSRLIVLDPSTGAITDGPAIPNLPACVAGLVSPCEPTLSLLPSEIAGLPLPLDDLGLDVADGLVGLDLPPELADIVVVSDGVYLVADKGQSVVWEVDGDRAEPFIGFNDRVPGEGPTSITVDRFGDLVVSISARLQSFPPAAPAIYSVPVINGTADEPRRPVDLDVAQPATDIAVGESGRVYAAVPSRNSVFDVGMEQGDVLRLDTDGADPALARPGALHLDDGWLYVAGSSVDGERWLVHRIGVADTNPATTPR